MASQGSNQVVSERNGRELACRTGEMMKGGVNRHGGLDFIKICRQGSVAYRGGWLKEASRSATDFGSQTPAMPVAYRYKVFCWTIACQGRRRELLDWGIGRHTVPENGRREEPRGAHKTRTHDVWDKLRIPYH
ncbi:hypothetical protein E3N88_23154 [Mikania micrantha]|uniref:Uncharacterized protein n=1 Tax=Mikania micrantha TaxID=192012 RepID=A0A5N6NDY4_9ASTR|nr:hypothetical protein E3N88_23154 [Mikania micrantha]